MGPDSDKGAITLVKFQNNLVDKNASNFVSKRIFVGQHGESARPTQTHWEIFRPCGKVSGLQLKCLDFAPKMCS